MRIVNKHGPEAYPRDGRDVGRTRLIEAVHKYS